MVNLNNRVHLTGHVGKMPEFRTTKNGLEMVSFTLATNEFWRDKSTDQLNQKTEWHKVVVYNEKFIKMIREHNVSSGFKLFIEGKLVYKKWEDQNGHQRISAEIEVSRFDGAVMTITKSSFTSDDEQGFQGNSSTNTVDKNHISKEEFGEEDIEDSDLDDESLPF